MDPAESIDVPTEHGLGRTGIVAARLLIEFDEVPETALFRVRRARAGTVEDGREPASGGVRARVGGGPRHLL